jgi:hypothetical protein
MMGACRQRVRHVIALTAAALASVASCSVRSGHLLPQAMAQQVDDAAPVSSVNDSPKVEHRRDRARVAVEKSAGARRTISPERRKVPASAAVDKPGSSPGSTTRCSEPSSPKSRGRAPRKAIDAPPCPTPAALVSTEGASPETTKLARASLENSETAHTPGATASIENLTFQNGDVPHARVALERIKKDFAKCAVNELGPAGGTAELRFIVRAAGRAEGVDVARVHGVSANIMRCVTSALTLRSVGAPSADPVGVILTVRFGNT